MTITPKYPPIDAIISAACHISDVTLDEFHGDERGKATAARMVAIAYMTDVRGMSYSEIKRAIRRPSHHMIASALHRFRSLPPLMRVAARMGIDEHITRQESKR